METKITERARRVYESWLNDPHVDEVTKEELMSIRNNAMEIEDRFYKDLEFGTGGMRGIMGAGTNRVNVYTIAKATQGLAELLLQNDDHAGNIPSVVIAYDSRHHSSSFAMEAARVLAGNGIKAYLFADMRPTPQLSFAVRHLRASAGIVITASHNPPEYNGYKVYGSSGGQLLPDEADRLIERVERIEQLSQVRRMSIEQAEELERIEWLKESIDDAYVQAVISNRVRPDVVRDMEDRFRIVYTPLHGSGLIPVLRALRAAGFSQVHSVKEQERPDGSFPTVHSPNPEEKEAFRIALQQAKQVDADIIIGTDPDCDRVGTLVKRADGEYEALNGNEIGALLLEYLLSSLKFNGKLPEDGAMIKTIVTGELGARIAKQYGIQVLNTLTGFKYIAEKMDQFEREGTPQFLFGYEESYGFLIGTHCRDKDAVVASVLLCEAACFYKQQGLTLVDVLHELYERHGVHLERQLSITRKGKEGMQQIARTMDAWRQTSYDRIAGVAVVRALDYEIGIEGLPRENVLKYELEDGSWICLRPSGTEPKLKAYLAVRKPTVEEAEQAMLRLKAFVEQRLEPEVTSVSHRSDKL